MKKSLTLCLILIGLLAGTSLSPITQYNPVLGSTNQILVPVDLVTNWNFTETEPGGWEGNDHNASKPTVWHFTGDTNGPKEQYRVINDTENDGDADTLFVQPARTNQAHTIMLWQDFTPLDISYVTVHFRSRATGPSALILLYGLNASISSDTPLPNGTLPCLTYLHPYNNETPGYWPPYTNVTLSLSNLTNTYHHYRIHWQITELPGKPDAQLYITYCRIIEAQFPLPPTWGAPGIHALLVVVTGIVISIIMVLFYLKHQGKLQFPKITRLNIKQQGHPLKQKNFPR